MCPIEMMRPIFLLPIFAIQCSVEPLMNFARKLKNTTNKTNTTNSSLGDRLYLRTGLFLSAIWSLSILITLPISIVLGGIGEIVVYLYSLFCLRR